MSFVARTLRNEARRYRALSRAINCLRTLSLLDEMACDLERKAEAMEAAADTQIPADETRRKR